MLKKFPLYVLIFLIIAPIYISIRSDFSFSFGRLTGYDKGYLYTIPVSSLFFIFFNFLCLFIIKIKKIDSLVLIYFSLSAALTLVLGDKNAFIINVQVLYSFISYYAVLILIRRINSQNINPNNIIVATLIVFAVYSVLYISQIYRAPLVIYSQYDFFPLAVFLYFAMLTIKNFQLWLIFPWMLILVLSYIGDIQLVGLLIATFWAYFLILSMNKKLDRIVESNYGLFAFLIITLGTLTITIFGEYLLPNLSVRSQIWYQVYDNLNFFSLLSSAIASPYSPGSFHGQILSIFYSSGLIGLILYYSWLVTTMGAHLKGYRFMGLIIIASGFILSINLNFYLSPLIWFFILILNPEKSD